MVRDGRFYATAEKVVRDAGYFLHFQGIDGPMFSGPRGEATAHFTFLARPLTPLVVALVAVMVAILV